MCFSENGKLDKVAWFISVFLFSSSIIFESYTWGKIILILGAAFLFLIDSFINHAKYSFRFSSIHKFILLLTLFSLMSSVWAVRPLESLQKAYSYFQILIFVSIIYNHFIVYDDEENLLSVLKWSSYVISVYSIIFYGYDFIIRMITMGVRIENSYTNINTIGMLASFGIILKIDEIIRNKRIGLDIILCIPNFVMLLATQSRKALLLLVFGVFMVLVFRNLHNRKILNSIIKVSAISLLAILAVILLARLEIFSGINSRMISLFALFTGKGRVDNSAYLRDTFIHVGLDIFKQHPIVGVGIGCPRFLNELMSGYDTYLHNGFIEALAGGGIVGFLIYYGSFFYLLYNFIRYRKQGGLLYPICFLLTLLLLFRDFAMVSMYDKSMFFFFLIPFIFVDHLKIMDKYKPEI